MYAIYDIRHIVHLTIDTSHELEVVGYEAMSPLWILGCTMKHAANSVTCTYLRGHGMPTLFRHCLLFQQPYIPPNNVFLLHLHSWQSLSATDSLEALTINIWLWCIMYDMITLCILLVYDIMYIHVYFMYTNILYIIMSS